MTTMPTQHEAKKVRSKFLHPLANLQVGDYYFLPGRKMRAVSPFVSETGTRLGRRFTVRTTQVTERLGTLVECAKDDPNAYPAVKVIRIM